MTVSGDAERPSEWTVVTAIVRLAIDDRGGIRLGELVDAETGATDRFHGWEGLVTAMRRWLGRAGRSDG